MIKNTGHSEMEWQIREMGMRASEQTQRILWICKGEGRCAARKNKSRCRKCIDL